MSEITIYTDGGCIRQGTRPDTAVAEGPGAWAWRAVHPDGTVKEETGSDPVTTNNRMEMMAAIKAMEALPLGAKAMITTDSQYLQQGFTTWWRNWMARGWRTADDKPVKNRELWQRMLAAAKLKQIRMTWVKGHAGNPHNERVDQLCTLEMRKLTGKQSRRERTRSPPLRCPHCRLALEKVEVDGRPHWTCVAWDEHGKEAAP